MKKKYWWAIILTLTVLVITGFLIFKKRSYTIHQAKRGDVIEAIYGLGKIKSLKVYEVKMGIMSNITKLYVHEGEKVQKGQLLISFDQDVLLRAPFEGTVSKIAYNEGEVVLPQTSVLRLENLKDRLIEVFLEQEAALRAKSGQKANVIFENLKQKKHIGVVEDLYPREGAFIANIKVEDLPANILPGMTADVVIEVGKKVQALLIPNIAISDGRVVRLRDEKKSVVEVSIGHTDGIWSELLSGDIQENDQLIVKRKK
jgi:macrolide-specific efflux system membrane fusion protein